MKVEYKPPNWLSVIEAVVSITLIVIAACTLTTQQCGVSQIGFSANIWLLVTGAVGLFYALYIFIVIAAAFCVCFICCLLPALIVVLLLKIAFFLAWAIVGIVMISLGTNFSTTCPLVFAFMIVGIIFLVLDIAPTYKYTTFKEN